MRGDASGAPADATLSSLADASDGGIGSDVVGGRADGANERSEAGSILGLDSSASDAANDTVTTSPVDALNVRWTQLSVGYSQT